MTKSDDYQALRWEVEHHLRAYMPAPDPPSRYDDRGPGIWGWLLVAALAALMLLR